MRRALIVPWVVLLAAVSCQGKRTSSAVHGAPPSCGRQCLAQITLLATEKIPSGQDLDRTAEDLAHGRMSLEAYVDGLLASEVFLRGIAPTLIFRQFSFAGAMFLRDDNYVLKKTQTSSGKTIYFLREAC